MDPDPAPKFKTDHINYGVVVLQPMRQMVRCVEEPDGTYVYEFTTAENNTVTRVRVDVYEESLRQARDNPLKRADAQ